MFLLKASQSEESIEGQLRECQEYAERHGLTIIATYIDRAFSARTDDRPEFQRMIKDSAKKLFEVVLVWKLDRFARSRTDSAMYKHVLKKNSVRVLSAKENISEGPEGIILEAMLEGMAEYYSAELAEKVLRGMTENALKCKYNGGSVPMGYTIDSDKHYQIDPVNAPIILEIFTRYADGESIVDIAASLNERGIRSPWGEKFNTNSSIHNILKNRKYMGEYRYRDIVQPGGIPALVPPELFERVEARMERNRKAPASAKAEVAYILTTKLFCGDCGAFMAGESGRGRNGVVHHYYKCSKAKRNNGCKKKAVKKEYIERLVVTETKRLVLQDEIIHRLADAIVELQQRESTALPLLRQQLRETEKGIENMLNAIQQGIITSSTKQRLEELEERQEELEISIAQEQMERPILTHEQIVHWVSRFKDGDVDDPQYRRNIVDIFVNAVYLYDDRIALFYNYKDGSKTVTLDEVNGSDLESSCPPKGQLHEFCSWPYFY